MSTILKVCGNSLSLVDNFSLYLNFHMLSCQNGMESNWVYVKNPFFLNSWFIHYSIRQFIKQLMIISTNLHTNQSIDQFMIRFLLIIKQLIGSKQSNDAKGLLKWKTIVQRATIQINPLCRWTITRKVLQSNGESSPSGLKSL